MRLIPKIIAVSIILCGCSSGDIAKFTSLGTDALVTCYSGGKVIYEGYSSGIVQSEKGSDGWYFKEKSTGYLVMVTGNCIIKHKNW